MPHAGLQTQLDTYTSLTSASRTSTGVQPLVRKGEVYIFRLEWVCNSGTPTLDVKIQHANADTASLYTDLVSFAQATTGSGTFEVQVPSASMGVLPFLRVVSSLAGTSPNYTATVRCFTN